jgi:DNA-binding GntR family transcriptional regulator
LTDVTRLNSDAPLYRQLAATLRDRIHDGTYPPGSALPAESAIGTEFDVGSTTVKRTLAALSQEGLITTVRGARATVRTPPKRRPVALHPDDRLITRMPSPAERAQLRLDSGVPIIEIRRSSGEVEVHAADQVEVVCAATPAAGGRNLWRTSTP